MEHLPIKNQSKIILIKSSIIIPVLVIIVQIFEPDSFLLFLKERFWIWLLVMLLHPIFSAYPQELIYRTFFFHRYKILFKSEKLKIWMSTFSFSFLHIIYDSWIAVILTFVGDYIFSLTYSRTKSLAIVSLEHGIYGNLV
ncbi:type II CAAX prenyl endopeptidase Rce1 family protein [Bacteroidota bacterium]